MRTILILLLCATAQAQTVEVYNAFGKQDDSTWTNQAIKVIISGSVSATQPPERWLQVARWWVENPKGSGFDPAYTYIYSKYKPVVTHSVDNPQFYQITFVQQ